MRTKVPTDCGRCLSAAFSPVVKRLVHDANESPPPVPKVRKDWRSTYTRRQKPVVQIICFVLPNEEFRVLTSPIVLPGY